MRSVWPSKPKLKNERKMKSRHDWMILSDKMR